MKNWKPFTVGTAVGILMMLLFVELIGPYTFLLSSEAGFVRANRLTGKAERYLDGWQELK